MGLAMSGVTFCAGSQIVDDRRVVSGLVLAIGSIGCIIDNTKSFADVGFTGKGTVVTFSDFHVYVSIAAKVYPEEVYSCLAPSVFNAGIGDSDSSFGNLGSSGVDCDNIELSIYAEVHMVEHAAAGGGIATTVHEAGEPSRFQRNLEADFELLSTPIAPGADPTKAAADLERMRPQIYDEALHLASTQRRLNATMREYNTVHGFEPARGNTEKLNEVRRKGGDLGGAMNRAGEPHEHSDIVLPEYSCPTQNMKAAEAAAAELPHLQGEELCQQAH